MIIETRKYKGHTIAKTDKMMHFPRGLVHTYIVLDGDYAKYFNPSWHSFVSWKCCKLFINSRISADKDNQ